MVVRTDSERVRHSRASSCSSSSASSVDSLDGAGRPRWHGDYGADPARFGAGRRRRPAGERDARGPGITTSRRPDVAATVAQPVKVDNDLYVRDYAQLHPLLQVRRGVRDRRAEHVRHRRRGPRVRRPHLDGVRRPAARVGLRLLRQLHRRVPDRRADVQERVRPARRRHVGRGRADRRPTRSARTAASAARSTLHVQDNAIVKVTSPLDHDVTTGTCASRAGSASSSSSGGRRTGPGVAPVSAIAGIVLAGGGSTRFGSDKLLASLPRDPAAAASGRTRRLR